MKTRYIIALAAAALALVGCQREELAEPGVLSGKEGVVTFAPSVGGILSAVKSSASADAPAATGTQSSLTLMSEDGSFTLPMNVSTTSLEAGAETKATLINDPGTATGSVKPLENFAASIDGTFWVAAWNTPEEGDKVKIIPDNPKGTALTGYVSGSDENGWYQKVAYRNGASGKYWMTIQNQTATVTGAPEHADDEYIWKKAETKTFYAYANVPEGATMAQLPDVGGQTMTCTDVPAQDVLMGYYSGNGSTGTSATQTGTASIHFHHPLAAVKIKTGPLMSGVTISSVAIEKVYGKGELKVKQVENVFTWTRSDGDSFKDENLVESISVTCDGAAELVLPQTFPSKARIHVTLQQDGKSFNVYSPLSGTWAPGTLYTYTVGYAPELLPGKFSVSAEKYVQFSRGNLFCTRSGSEGAYSYSFALEEKQYEYHTRYDVPHQNSSSQIVEPTSFPGLKYEENRSGLFQWVSTNAQGRTPDILAGYGAFSALDESGCTGNASDIIDFGKAYGNGTTWSTLTSDEMQFLLDNHFTKWSTVCGVTGCIIAPDGWTGSIDDSYDASSWPAAESAGLVFLPAAGNFNAENYSIVYNVSTQGYGWSQSPYSESTAYYMDFSSAGAAASYADRYYAMSVRLVQKFEKKERPELLDGKFSISAMQYVQFSRGNLFCTRGSESGPYNFSFEREQYESRTRYGLPQYADGSSRQVPVRNTTPENTSGLFQWDTDATTSDYGAFGTSQSVTSSARVMDWGPAVGSEWTTMSISDFSYMLNERPGSRYAKATVCGVAGLLIFPDGWTNPNGWTINGINVPNAEYGGNIINYTTSLRWPTLQAEGIVFLPAAGCMASAGREAPEAFVGVVGTIGDYWSKESSTDDWGRYLTITPELVSTEGEHWRDYGRAVRLVQKFVKSVRIGDLYWATENLAITEYGKREFSNTGHINGDYFQWAAYAGYCGNATDADKGLLVYTSFTSSMCGDGSDSFALKPDKAFQPENSPYYSGSAHTKYTDAHHATLDRTGAYTGHNDDVANFIIGDDWRMPTFEDFKAMCTLTYWAWDDMDKGYYVFLPGKGTSGSAGSRGIIAVTDNKAKAALFFPAAGFGDGGDFRSVNSEGTYWSSSLNYTYPSGASYLYFSKSEITPRDGNGRRGGFTVRPVKDAD